MTCAISPDLWIGIIIGVSVTTCALFLLCVVILWRLLRS